MNDISSRRDPGSFPIARPLSRTLATVAVVVILIAAFTFLIYAKRFGGGLSDKQEVWGAFGDYYGGVLSAVPSPLSLVIALYVLLGTNEEKRLEQIYKFPDEFRSDRMSRNLKLLWDFYDYKDCRNHKGRFEAEASKKRELLMARYRTEHMLMTDIYLARRSVSYFYLHLAIFVRNTRLNEKNVLALWPASSYSTLEDIIMPCEQAIVNVEAIPDKFIHFEYLLERWRLLEIWKQRVTARNRPSSA